MGETMRRTLTVVLVVIALGAACLLTSGCASGEAAAEPSLSPMEMPRLVNLSDFALLPDRPTQIRLHIVAPQRIRVVFISRRLVESCSLWRVASPDGSLLTPVRVPLEGGNPHANSGTHVIYWFGSPSLGPGYYRIDLTGRGRILNLIVDRRRS